MPFSIISALANFRKIAAFCIGISLKLFLQVMISAA